MPQNSPSSLWLETIRAGNLNGRFLAEDDEVVALDELASGSILSGRRRELQGKSVLIATTGHLSTTMALLEFDGVAKRLTLCPADLPAEHIPYVATWSGAAACVADRPVPGWNESTHGPLILCRRIIENSSASRVATCQTEWILLTSGTSGFPKLVVHTLSSLSGAIGKAIAPQEPIVWSTFYDIRRYGGLQILLRALLGSGSLVFSGAQPFVLESLLRAAARRVTHFTGTPSHWRRVLMNPYARQIDPSYIRISGEIADQSLLDQLRSLYPRAEIVHAFASTEAGVGFEVRDGLAGFPSDYIAPNDSEVCLRVTNNSLRIRSLRTASRYLGPDCRSLADTEGFVDTGDLVRLRGNRYYFAGRRDGMINVGGNKVCPEEVESVINSHPHVLMSLVRPRSNPITGAIVVAEVTLTPEAEAKTGSAADRESEILQLCRRELPRHKVPAVIQFVRAPDLSASGKTIRCHA